MRGFGRRVKFANERGVFFHWDNLQEKCSRLNLSGRSQLDGPTELVDLDRTESNKNVVKAYADTVTRRQKAKHGHLRGMSIRIFPPGP